MDDRVRRLIAEWIEIAESRDTHEVAAWTYRDCAESLERVMRDEQPHGGNS